MFLLVMRGNSLLIVGLDPIIMNRFNLNTVLSTLAFGVAALASPLAAQQGKVAVDKPDFDDLQSPEVGGNTGKKNFKPKDWLEVEVKFKVEMPSSYTEKFVDAVTVKWYVAAKNPSGKGFILIEKEVNHVNVPVGEDVYASVYLSPISIQRLSGSESASKSVIDRIGGEIFVNGSPAVKNSGKFSSKGKPDWWASGSLSRSEKIPLLNKNETPFKFLWWDRYAEIKAERD